MKKLNEIQQTKDKLGLNNFKIFKSSTLIRSAEIINRVLIVAELAAETIFYLLQL